MAKDVATTARTYGSGFMNFLRLAQYEVKWGSRVPLRKRLWAWRRGFLSISVDRYNLMEGDRTSLYVSEWARFIRTPNIDGRFGPALNNKIVFSRILASYGCRVPHCYCLIRDGSMTQVGSRLRMRTPEDVLAACRAGGHFIVKPSSGGGGESVSVLRSEGDCIVMNEQGCADDVVVDFLEGLDDAVIVECLEQHEYARKIFPHSANSMRILTMWDYEKREPFIASVVHRFGTHMSIPVDNSSKGGLFCPVDVATGELGTALTSRLMGEPRWVERHPDTGEPISGVRLPHWDAVTDGVLDLCRKMAYIPYIGWDVLITPTGFAVFEGNSYPALGYQIFEPLLVNPRVRAFYERYGVV